MRQHQSHSQVKVTPNSSPVLIRFFQSVSPNSFDTTDFYQSLTWEPLQTHHLTSTYKEFVLLYQSSPSGVWLLETHPTTARKAAPRCLHLIRTSAVSNRPWSPQARHLTPLSCCSTSSNTGKITLSAYGRGPRVGVLIWLLTQAGRPSHAAVASLGFFFQFSF